MQRLHKFHTHCFHTTCHQNPSDKNMQCLSPQLSHRSHHSGRVDSCINRSLEYQEEFTASANYLTDIYIIASNVIPNEFEVKRCENSQYNLTRQHHMKSLHTLVDFTQSVALKIHSSYSQTSASPTIFSSYTSPLTYHHCTDKYRICPHKTIT